MSRNTQCIVTIFLSYFAIYPTHSTETLTLQKSSSVFPHRLVDAITLYDNLDSIYIFGGESDTPSSNIYRYSIADDTLTLLTSTEPSIHAGSVNIDTSGNVFLFKNRTAHIFDPKLYTLTPIAALDDYTSVDHATPAKYNDTSNRLYFLRGSHPYASCFDMETLQVCRGYPIARSF